MSRAECVNVSRSPDEKTYRFCRATIVVINLPHEVIAVFIRRECAIVDVIEHDIAQLESFQGALGHAEFHVEL